jgi:hypothetical protein
MENDQEMEYDVSRIFELPHTPYKRDHLCRDYQIYRQLPARAKTSISSHHVFIWYLDEGIKLFHVYTIQSLFFSILS